MKNFKKFLTLVLAVMMVVSSVAFSTSAATTKFEDIDAKNEELVKAVDLLNYMGVAKGTSETTFGADELVTRQQFALFIYRLLKGGKDAPVGASNSTKFTDLEDPTYFYAISWANAQGIVNGKSETTFGPKDPIKLQEAYAMIVRALDWEEEEELVYPYDHIEIAEQAGVELDAGLPSGVDYADELTRADMAILLYNAFFAETGIEEVGTRERLIGTGDDNDDNDTWVIEEYTTNPRLCEKAFDVIEVTYKAIGTPNYKFGEGEVTYDLGYDAIYFEEVAETPSDMTAAPNYAYIAAEDMGLDADELNDYFLGEFTMFVTLDDDNDIEKVLFADCNMVKKTVTDIKLGEIASNKVDSYFDDAKAAKLLSGKLIADGEEIYVYNAPYSYSGLTYGISDTTAEAKYGVKNDKNIMGISFSMEKEDEVPVYTVEEFDLVDDEYDEDGLYADEAVELVEAFEQVYYGGYYEADLYDVEGDGIYDYINYKPYLVFQVDTNEDEYFEDYADMEDVEFGDIEGIPYVYVNGATLLGEEFENEDYVIGYYSTDVDVVKVAAVLEPTVAAVKSAKKGVVTLTNGEKADAVSRWSKVANFKPDDVVYDADAKNAEVAENSPLFTTEYIGGDETAFYIYDGVVLFYDEVSSNVKFAENLIIPTTLDGEKPVKEAPFNPEADNLVYYVYAWVDGTTKYVQVEVDDEVTPFVFDEDSLELGSDFENKLCTYTVSDGLYTITPLTVDVVDVDDADDIISEALSTDTDLLGTSDDEGKADDQVYVEGLGATIEKSGSRFDIGLEINGKTRYVAFKSYTKIIIRVQDDDEYDYVELGASDFTKSLDEDVELENMVAIVSNNDDSEAVENLVVLYAETDDELNFKGKQSTDGLRIVSNWNIDQDADGEWRIYYDLLNPFTGARESDVASERSEEKSKNIGAGVAEQTFVKLADGFVDDEDLEFKVHGFDKAEYALDEANLVWIAEVDEAEGTFVVVPYNEALTSAKEVETFVESFDEDDSDYAVTDIYGHEIEGNYVAFDKNTVVSTITYDAYNNDMWKYGTFGTSSMSAVAKAGKDLLCYNENARTGKENDQETTRYSEFVKAYISVDHDVDEDEEPLVEYIIVVINKQEGTVEYK